MEDGEKEIKKVEIMVTSSVKTVKKIVKSSIKFNIPIVTFYVFSSENWKD